MLNDSIRILNFDDSVINQKQLLASYRHRIVDLKMLGGQARYYSSPKIRNIIADKLGESGSGSVTFLGSGDFHHISEVLLSKFEQPLSVIVFDFHPDWEVFPPRYGCGSWVTEILRHKGNVAKLILLGPSSCDISSFKINSGYLEGLKDDRVEIYPYEHSPSKVFLKRVPENVSIEVDRGIVFNTIRWKELRGKNLKVFLQDVLKRIPTKDVYVSIDKDCLKSDFALTNWEEGKFSLDELLLLLGLIKEGFNILGLDITGDYSPVTAGGLFKRIALHLDHPRNNQAAFMPESAITGLNEQTNLRILELINS